MRIHYTADPSKRGEEFKEEGIEARGRSWWEQQMEMSEDVYSGEAVFKDFIFDSHCPQVVRENSIPIVDNSLFFAGWDTGQTHQHAFELAMVTPIGQTFWILEVVPSEGCPLSIFAPIVLQNLKERLPGHWMDVYHVSDPAGKQRAGTDFLSAFDILNDLGICLNAASTNSPQIREDAVNWLLRRKIALDNGKATQGVIYGAVDCPVLVEGMKGAYCLTEPKNGPQGFSKVLRSPAKNFYSHCIAKGELIETVNGPVPVEQIKRGDLVLTRKGYRPVLGAGLSGEDRRIIEVRDSKGNSVKLTPDHKILANGQFSRTDTVQYGTILSCVDKRSLLTAIISTDTPNLSICQTDGTIRDTSKTERCTRIDTYGKNTTARYKKDSTSTTSTATARITRSATSNVSAYQTTFTDATEIRRQLTARRASPRPSRWLKSGIEAKLALSGTERTASRLTRLERQSPIRASIAGIKRKQRLTERECSALLHASRHSGGRQALTTKIERAPYAESCFLLTSTHEPRLAESYVLSVSDAGRSDVYDITVDGCHEFYAGGILVHNCNDAHQYASLEIRRFLTEDDEPARWANI